MELCWNTGRGHVISRTQVKNNKILNLKERGKARTEVRDTQEVGSQVTGNEDKGENEVLKLGEEED